MRHNRSLTLFALIAFAGSVFQASPVSAAQYQSTFTPLKPGEIMAPPPFFPFKSTPATKKGCEAPALSKAFDIGFTDAKEGVRPAYTYTAGFQGPDAAKETPFQADRMFCQQSDLSPLLSSSSQAQDLVDCCVKGYQVAEQQVAQHIAKHPDERDGCTIAYEEGKEVGTRNAMFPSCMAKYIVFPYMGCFMMGKKLAEQAVAETKKAEAQRKLTAANQTTPGPTASTSDPLQEEMTFGDMTPASSPALAANLLAKKAD